MTSRSHAYLLSLFCCRLIIIILNPNPKVCPHTHLITLWVLYSSLTLPGELSGSSSSILLLSCWTQMWYSLLLSLNNTEGDLGLCALTSRERPLTSSKLLFKLNMAPMGSVTMSISSLKTTFKELELMFFFKLQKLLAVVVVECVIFANSLIGATI